MRVADPRLLGSARSTRVALGLAVAVGVMTALLVVAQAWLLAEAITGAFLGGEDLAALRGPVRWLLAVVAARAVVGWAGALAAQRSAAAAKSELRSALLAQLARLGPGRLGRGRTGAMVTLATRGIDALDGYFGRYLPELVLAVVVPLIVVVAVVTRDLISAVILAVTVPLIPVFTVLIGSAVGNRSARQFHTLQRLAGHFLDVVAGLPTLKVFGRAKAQARAIAEVTDAYRQATMQTLRLAFVSSLALELLSTISVALVAVAVGLRLQNGTLGLRTGLFVLILAPEVYLPVRALAADFHASAEGLRAAEQAFAVLDEPAPARGSRTDVPDLRTAAIVVEDLTVRYPDRPVAALDRVSLRVEPGELLAVTGPSGCGKSTLLAALLGFVLPESGGIRVGTVPVGDLDPDAWRARIGWVAQRPHLFAGSLADNVRLGRRDATAGEVWAAVRDAGLGPLVGRLPAGLDTRLGERGAGLSAGERQRVALARAFLRDAPLLLLDEPTANLDGRTEAEVLAAVRRLARGRTVMLIAHRPALVALADRVVSLAPAEVAA